MESLIKNLTELNILLKKETLKPSTQTPKLPTLPTIKPPQASPITPPKAAAPKLPGVSAASTKNPKKIAEQMMKPGKHGPKIEMLKFDSNGQWSLK